jgi:hypothetical protein
MLASSPAEMRPTLKKAFIQANAEYEQNKNRKFSDPATAQKGGNRNNNTKDS